MRISTSTDLEVKTLVLRVAGRWHGRPRSDVHEAVEMVSQTILGRLSKTPRPRSLKKFVRRTARFELIHHFQQLDRLRAKYRSNTESLRSSADVHGLTPLDELIASEEHDLDVTRRTAVDEECRRLPIEQQIALGVRPGRVSRPNYHQQKALLALQLELMRRRLL